MAEHGILYARYADPEPPGGYAADAAVIAVHERYGEQSRRANDDIHGGGMLAFLADSGTIGPYEAAPNGEVWRWSGGAWVDARTPEELATAAQAAKTAAKERLAAQADHMARAVTGIVPLAEQLSWPVKEAAARAHQAGTADAGQTALLAAEAGVTGETVGALVEKILANAVAYHMAAGFIAGWRRKTMEAIDVLADDATVGAGIATIVAQAAMEAEAALAALG